MSLLDDLERPAVWQAYREYKARQSAADWQEKDLEKYIEKAAYLPVLRGIREGEAFPLPVKKEIVKAYSGKKRVVYTYPGAYNRVLKVLTWRLLREYDHLFSPNLYSFRPGHGAKEAIRRLTGIPGIGKCHVYKADISDYFNSVDLDLFLPVLSETLADDPALYTFLSELLKEPLIYDHGLPLPEEKGIMAGTPLACFYANLFLADLDRYFEERSVPYARYSDDIIVFGKTEEELNGYVNHIRACLSEKHLKMNPEKEVFTRPGEKWTFLGFSWQEGKLDIAPASLEKLKGKMRRKREALRRWQIKKGLSGEKAAKGFVKAYNRKLFETAGDNDLTWTRWYFPVINTTESLKALDLYAQDCLRYLISGKHTKARFNVRYADLKALGYRSLVHEYYEQREEKTRETPE